MHLNSTTTIRFLFEILSQTVFIIVDEPVYLFDTLTATHYEIYRIEQNIEWKIYLLIFHYSSVPIASTQSAWHFL